MLLHYEDVRRWLLGQAPTTICGYRKSALSCPLAQYLWEKTGVLHSVGEGYGPYLARHAVTGDRPLPRWAAEFVELVDCGPAHRGVSVGEALACLALIQPDRRLVIETAIRGDPRRARHEKRPI